MPTLSEIFDKRKILLYQNESLDLDHYYQEPYQDENDEIKEMGKPFETNESKKIRTLDLVDEDQTYSGFGYFMDGSRRTYKIGDMVLAGKKIYPVVVAQIRAGCTARDRQKKLHTHGSVQRKNLLLLSDKMNEVDFQEIRQRILKTQMAKDLHLNIVQYHFEPAKDNVPVNAAIAKANSMMHDMEIDILGQMVNSGTLEPDHMLMWMVRYSSFGRIPESQSLRICFITLSAFLRALIQCCRLRTKANGVEPRLAQNF